MRHYSSFALSIQHHVIKYVIGSFTFPMYISSSYTSFLLSNGKMSFPPPIPNPSDLRMVDWNIQSLSHSFDV